jgi:hypothetical protein
MTGIHYYLRRHLDYHRNPREFRECTGEGSVCRRYVNNESAYVSMKCVWR